MKTRHDVPNHGAIKERRGTSTGPAAIDVRGLSAAIADGYRAAMLKRGLSVGFNGRRHGSAP